MKVRTFPGVYTHTVVVPRFVPLFIRINGCHRSLQNSSSSILIGLVNISSTSSFISTEFNSKVVSVWANFTFQNENIEVMFVVTDFVAVRLAFAAVAIGTVFHSNSLRRKLKSLNC